MDWMDWDILFSLHKKNANGSLTGKEKKKYIELAQMTLYERKHPDGYQGICYCDVCIKVMRLINEKVNIPTSIH